MADGPDTTCGYVSPQIPTSLYVRLLAHLSVKLLAHLSVKLLAHLSVKLSDYWIDGKPQLYLIL
jgi:hypothetical protein